MASGSLWISYRDGMNDDANENNVDIYRTDKIQPAKLIEHNTKIIENAPVDSNTLDIKVFC